MTHLKRLSISIIAASSAFAHLAEAKSGFPNLQPAAYNGAIGCTSCHTGSPYTGGNVGQPYGRLFNTKVGYNNASATGFIRLEGDDSDGDGFTNGQEIYGFSDFNTGTSKPLLLGVGVKVHGTASAKALVNETIDSMTQVLTTPASVVVPTGERNIGGTIDLTLSNLTLDKASPTLLFNTGGIAKGAKAYFIDASGAATAITTATVNNSGSITLQLTDEGPYDLYTQASYIASAKTRTPSVATTATISPYATVSNLAVISPYATINDYATVGAYAIIGDYAIVDTYATVDDYAVVANNVTVAANATQAAPTDYLGVIQTKVAVVTPSPLGQTLTDGGAASSTTGTTGQLHCMTSGLSTYGFMLLGLLTTGLLVRRKKK